MPRKRPVSQYATEQIGIAIYDGGELVDPDADVRVTVTRDTDSAVVVGPDAPATRDDVGLYSLTLTPSLNEVKSEYTVNWEYEVLGDPRSFVDTYIVVDPMPYWDSLSAAEREVVLSVYHKVSDTFDSREGGPYLWEIYQTQFNAFETISRLMATDAITYINFSYQPAFIPPYTVGANATKAFPSDWNGLLEQATYHQFLRHLSRSYIEQPAPQGITAARLDRAHYRQEWATEAKEEKEVLDRMLMFFKRKFLVGTKRALLVAGGNIPYMYINPAQPNFMYSVSRW